MEVNFNRTIDITIKSTDECYVRVTTGQQDGDICGSTWLSMPLDTAIELYEQLDSVIEEAKAKLNAQIEWNKEGG